MTCDRQAGAHHADLHLGIKIDVLLIVILDAIGNDVDDAYVIVLLQLQVPRGGLGRADVGPA